MDPAKTTDQRVIREWYLLTFHEAGHATWFAHSVHVTPLRIGGLTVERPWFDDPHGSGWTEFEPNPTLGRLLNPHKPPTMRELLDYAAGAMAGPISEARWMHFLEGADFDSALEYCYETGGASDYAGATAALGGSTALIRRAEGMARDLVAREWDAIVHMAEAAREQERLAGREIRRTARERRR